MATSPSFDNQCHAMFYLFPLLLLYPHREIISILRKKITDRFSVYVTVAYSIPTGHTVDNIHSLIDWTCHLLAMAERPGLKA